MSRVGNSHSEQWEHVPWFAANSMNVLKLNIAMLIGAIWTKDSAMLLLSF